SLNTAYDTMARHASQGDWTNATDEESGTALMTSALKLRPLDTARSSAREGQAAFQASCAAVTGPLSIATTIGRTADAQHMITLADGRNLALPGGLPGNLAEGVSVTTSGVHFSDDTGVALDVRPDHPEATVSTGAPKLECMGVRILPFQEGL